MVKDGTAQLAVRQKLIPEYQITKPRGTKKDIIDVAPHVPAAGIKGGANLLGITGSTAPFVPQEDNFESIPQEQLRWRQSFRRQPGVQMANPGTYLDPIPSMLEYRHGIRTSSGDKAADCLRQQNVGGFEAYINEQKEKHYRSHKVEPLGRPYVRGHVLPKEYEDPNFRFGIKSSSSESAKSLLTQSVLGKGGVEAEPRTMRGGTVIDAPPGAGPDFVSEQDVCRQTNRQYNWGNIDPHAFRFGSRPVYSDLSSSQAVRECLEAADPTRPDHVTHIASDRVKLFNMTRHSDVGRSRPPSKEIASLGQEHVFGVPSTRDNWTMKQAIEGNLTAEEQLPEPDLGKPFRRFPHLRNNTDEQGEDRVYGVPSMRFDLPEPARKSIADDTNYGTEHSAAMLLRPYPYDVPGVTTESFKQPRTPEQLRAIFEQAGRRFEDNVFELLVQATLSRTGVLSVSNMKETIAIHEEQARQREAAAAAAKARNNSNSLSTTQPSTASASNAPQRASPSQSKIAALASRYSR